jgi:hypothetical protein
MSSAFLQMRGISVHWSVTTHRATVADILRAHTLPKPQGNGWPHIGYHYIILHENSDEFRGKPPTHWGHLIKNCLDVRKVGYHTEKNNTGHIGVCLIGGPDHPVSEMQLEALRQGAKIWAVRHNFNLKSPVGIRGHKEFPSNATRCPGPDILRVARELRGW